MRNYLRFTNWILPALLAAAAPAAHAGCGDVSQIQAPFTFAASDATSNARTLVARAAAATTAMTGRSDAVVNTASIVGMWSIQLISQGNTTHNPPIPDGVVIDFGYQQWHSDGTEVTNSGARPAATGNICFGVFVRSGYFTYELNHAGIGDDATTGQVNGISIIHMNVTLDPSGNEFAGPFTIDVFDPTTNAHVDHLAGTITGKRFTVDQTTP